MFIFFYICIFNLIHIFVFFVDTINILLPFAYSEDGFYATWIKAPLEGGQWSVEAVSLSPFHGMRMAQPQPLLRTKPIHLRIEGIPTTMRRGEILANFTLMARNNMPISLQVLFFTFCIRINEHLYIVTYIIHT